MNFEGLLEVSNTEAFLAQQRHTLESHNISSLFRAKPLLSGSFKSFNLHSTWVEIETPEFRQVEKKKMAYIPYCFLVCSHE